MEAILGHGIDIVSISRMREVLARQGEHFQKRVFGEAERKYCLSKSDPVPHFAARFAAKEAYGKALSLGLGPSGNFSEIEVEHNERGAPSFVLKASAKEIFLSKGGAEIFLSISHDGDMAMASVIVTKKSCITVL